MLTWISLKTMEKTWVHGRTKDLHSSSIHSIENEIAWTIWLTSCHGFSKKRVILLLFFEKLHLLLSSVNCKFSFFFVTGYLIPGTLMWQRLEMKTLCSRQHVIQVITLAPITCLWIYVFHISCHLGGGAFYYSNKELVKHTQLCQKLHKAWLLDPTEGKSDKP